jgi:FkbM family methyltransferase
MASVAFPLLKGVPGDVLTRFVHDGKGWEPHIQQLIAAIVSAGATVVDVGANIGVHTVALARAVGPDGVVLAIEPNPDVLPLLQENTADLPVVKIVPCIAGRVDKSDGGAMGRRPTGNIGAIMVDTSNPQGPIPQVRLDTLLAGERAPSFIKIDVQGCEHEVLAGAVNTLACSRPLLLVEIEEKYLRSRGSSSVQVLEVLLRARYTLYRIRATDPRLVFFADHFCIPDERATERDWAALTGYACDVLTAGDGLGPLDSVQCEFGPEVEHAYTMCRVVKGTSPLLAIHVMAYNEAALLPLFVRFYKPRFEGYGCVVIVHDNDSTDDTVAVAHAMGCKTKVLSTSGFYDEFALTARRSGCWVSDDTHSTWVLVVDMDEFCDICPELLLKSADMDVMVATGFDMVSSALGGWPTTVTTGVPSTLYSKPVLFRRAAVQAVDFSLGSHSATWTKRGEGAVCVRRDAFVMYHYHLFAPDHALFRRLQRKTRRAPHMSSGIDTQSVTVTTLEDMVQTISAMEKRPDLCVVPGAADLFTGKVTAPNFTRDWTQFTQAVLQRIRDGSLAVPSTGDVLEVGVFEGRTTLDLLRTFPVCRVHCIDPWYDGPYSSHLPIDFTGQYGRFLSNVCGVPSKRLSIHRGLSDVVLPTLVGSFRFAFIDGDHSAEAVYRDACNVWPLLQHGGLMLFDDYLWDGMAGVRLPDSQLPKPGIDKWLSEHTASGDASIESLGYQVLVRKI